MISEIYLHLDILLNFEGDIPVKTPKRPGRPLPKQAKRKIFPRLVQGMESPPSTIQKKSK